RSRSHEHRGAASCLSGRAGLDQPSPARVVRAASMRTVHRSYPPDSYYRPRRLPPRPFHLAQRPELIRSADRVTSRCRALDVLGLAAPFRSANGLRTRSATRPRFVPDSFLSDGWITQVAGPVWRACRGLSLTPRLPVVAWAELEPASSLRPRGRED